MKFYFLLSFYTFAATDELSRPINVHRQVPLTSILVSTCNSAIHRQHRT